MNLYFHRTFHDGGFETTSKAADVAARLVGRQDVDLVAPQPATRAELEGIHHPDYVDAVLTGEPRDLAGSAGLGWDGDLLRSWLASTGGCRDSATAAWAHGVSGTLSSGLHHAGRAGGEGFCTFNGLVLAVDRFRALGAGKVLVLDLDAHCGGGTADIVGADPSVVTLDVSVSAHDCYERRGAGNTLDVVGDPDDYLPTIARRLGELDLDGIGAVVYNAGMDPHGDCPVGGLQGITSEVLAGREDAVFSFAAHHRLPIMFALAGGYLGSRLRRRDLADLHLLTVDAATASLAAGDGDGADRRRR